MSINMLMLRPDGGGGGVTKNQEHYNMTTRVYIIVRPASIILAPRLVLFLTFIYLAPSFCTPIHREYTCMCKINEREENIHYYLPFNFFSCGQTSMASVEPYSQTYLQTHRSCRKSLSQDEKYISHGKSNCIFRTCREISCAAATAENHVSLDSYVLQRCCLLRELHQRTHREGGLVALCHAHREIADQTSCHVSHQNCSRVDQSCYFCRYAHVYATCFWLGTGVAQLQVSICNKNETRAKLSLSRIVDGYA